MSDLVEIRQTEWLAIETPGDVQVIELPVETIELLEIPEQGPAGPPGAAGAQGPQGIPGLSGASYVHTQAVPDADWSIAHNLGRYPSVTVVDSASTVVFGNVEYISVNLVIVHFNGAFGGAAFLN